MYQTIFECNTGPDTPLSIVLWMLAIILVILACILGLILLFLRDLRTNKVKWYYYATLLYFLFFSVYSVVTFPLRDVQITKKYYAGDYSVEEGMVEVIYIDGDTTNYFFVMNELIFPLDGYAGSFSCEYHEQCLEDGQYARISYVNYWDKNYIMKIEIPIDEQKNNE